MTPEQGAVELIRRGLPPRYAGRFVTDGRLDTESLEELMYTLSSGEQVVANTALDLWRSTGRVGAVSRTLDRDNRALVLGVLSAVWLGDE